MDQINIVRWRLPSVISESDYIVVSHMPYMFIYVLILNKTNWGVLIFFAFDSDTRS